MELSSIQSINTCVFKSRKISYPIAHLCITQATFYYHDCHPAPSAKSTSRIYRGAFRGRADVWNEAQEGNSLPFKYMSAPSLAVSISIIQGAPLLVKRRKVLPTYTHQSTPAFVGLTIVTVKPGWKSRGGHCIVYKVARVRSDGQGHPLLSRQRANVLLAKSLGCQFVLLFGWPSLPSQSSAALP